MRLVAAKEWNFQRKLMGNLVPILGGLPFGVIGIKMAFENEGVFGPQLAVLCGMPVAGWLLMNFIGLWGNRGLRASLAKKLSVAPGQGIYFVGLARPSYRGLLDPHEDVGFLIEHPDSLEFRGESLSFRLNRPDLLGVCYRPNVHTLVGLGRWISVEGKLEGKPIRLLVEPRERPTLLGNLRFSKALKFQLQGWLKGNGPRN